MSALPANSSGPVAADETRPRHLRPVPPEDITEAPDEVTAKAEAADRGGVAAWLREVAVPGSGLYTDRQPSVSEIVRRARRGSQVAAHGPLRALSTVHGYVAAANKAVATTWVWIVDHPARLFVATVLLALAVVYPPTRHLLVWLLAPFAWAYDALAALD